MALINKAAVNINAICNHGLSRNSIILPPLTSVQLKRKLAHDDAPTILKTLLK